MGSGTPRARRRCSNWVCPCSVFATVCRRWPSQLGGKVESGQVREFGYAEVRARGHSALLKDLQDRANAEGHGLPMSG